MYIEFTAKSQCCYVGGMIDLLASSFERSVVWIWEIC